jgi:hypothetical protein
MRVSVERSEKYAHSVGIFVVFFESKEFLFVLAIFVQLGE